MAVLRVYRVYKHQIQLSTYLRLIDNFNQGLRFVDLVVYFDKTKTVLGLRFVDTPSFTSRQDNNSNLMVSLQTTFCRAFTSKRKFAKPELVYGLAKGAERFRKSHKFSKTK